jgi:hypothetical protein
MHINILLKFNRLVFSGSFPEQEDLIQTWNFYSTTVNDENIEELYNNLFSQLSPWSSYMVEKTTEQITVSLISVLIVESLDDKITSKDQEYQNIYINQINQYVQAHKGQLSDYKVDYHMFQKDLTTCTFQMDGGNRSPEIESLLKNLSSQNINYHIEYEYGRVDDHGASGGVYEIIFYIASVALSGATYDLLKKFSSLIITNVKKDKIDMIKDKLSYHLNTQPENLILIQLSKDEKTGIYFATFKFNRDYFEVTFNREKDIIKYKIKD